MKFLFELYKNPKDNENFIKALTNEINYCDTKTYNSLIHNKNKIFENGNYNVEITNNSYNYTKLSSSKSKGILINLRILPFYDKYWDYKRYNNSYQWDKSFNLKSGSVLSIGVYRLYKNEIYKLCNKT